MLHHLFSAPYRALFLLSGIFGPLLLLLWLSVLYRYLPLPLPRANPIAWHAHEMIFGWVGAAIGGFLFTAVANWTGRPAVSGSRLAALVFLWVAGRVVMAVDFGLGPLVVATVDLSYFLLASMLFARELRLGGNRRNYVVLALFVMIGCFNGGYHLAAVEGLEGWEQPSLRGGLFSILVFISLIGGRIIPAFTRNWLRANGREGEPPAFGWPDRAAIASTLICLPAWVLAPDHRATALILVVCGLLQGVRLSRWCWWRVLSEPLMWVLHLAYLWLAAGLVVLGCALLFGFPQSVGVHALTVGAIATMVVAVSARASLGHSNRELIAGPVLTLAIGLLTVAAVLRLTAGLTGWVQLLPITGLFWVGAFTCYLIRIVPVLLARPLVP